MFLRLSLPLITAFALIVAGCGDDSDTAESTEPTSEPEVLAEPTADPETPATPTAAGPTVPPFCPGGGAPTAGAELSDPRFTIRAVADEGYVAGELGQFRVEVDAAEGWHVNQEFNTQLHVRPSEPLQLAATTIGQPAASEFDDHHARFAVPVTPSNAGQHRAETCLSFAICTDETCVPVAPSVAVVLPVQ